MFKEYRMSEEQHEKVREILLLPTAGSDDVHDTAAGQVASLVDFFQAKLADYTEVVQQNSQAVFVVNYVQNRFISSEFCAEIAKLFDVVKVKSVDELLNALDGLKSDPELKASVEALEDTVLQWDAFLADIDAYLDNSIGPCNNVGNNNNNNNSDEADRGGEIAELDLQSKTISYYVQGSPFDLVLIVVVRSFNRPEANEHILELYKRINELRKMGCDVFLLTRGPPIGSRGGSYIKLIGVPFRKLYDAHEAEVELRTHRRSAVKLASWSALCKMVEMSATDDGRPASTTQSTTGETPVSFLSQKGGTLLVNKKGDVLYKHIEEESNPWPSIDEIIRAVGASVATTKDKKKPGTSSGRVNLAKVDSEVSVGKEVLPDKKKPCCTIL